MSCLSVWTDEWCFVYSPISGLEGSELYRRDTDPTQTNNVIAANHPVAEQHFQFLCGWLDELRVPQARKEQLLHATEFGRKEKIKHWFWMQRNRWHYWKNYRDYARQSVKGSAISGSAGCISG